MTIADNVERVQASIADACAKVNRDPADVTLVAISKLKTAEDIMDAIEAGVRHLGENRVEESVTKISRVNELASARVTWHMVGHVQSRKVKQVVPLFDIVQSVDSLRLAQRFSRIAAAQRRNLDVLLEVNVSGEASKYGFAGYNWCRDSAVKDQLIAETREIAALPQLRVRGLMTMAPFESDEDGFRRVFADLYALREELSNDLEVSLPELSMGMSNDYQIAIEEGATTVRIGRAIFGERS